MVGGEGFTLYQLAFISNQKGLQMAASLGIAKSGTCGLQIILTAAIIYPTEGRKK